MPRKTLAAKSAARNLKSKRGSPECSTVSKKSRKESKDPTDEPMQTEFGTTDTMEQDQMRKLLLEEAEMGEILEEGDSEERKEIASRTMHLARWEEELADRQEGLRLREEVLGVMERDVQKRSDENDKMREELEAIRVKMEDESAKANSSGFKEYLKDLQTQAGRSKNETNQMREKVRALRAELEATNKRLTRLQATQSQRRGLITTKKQERSVRAFTKCDELTKEKRIDECTVAIRTAVGTSDENTSYVSILKRVMSEIHERLELKTRLTIDEDLRFCNVFNLPQNTREHINSFLGSKLWKSPFRSNAAIRDHRKSLANEEDWEFKVFSDSGGAADGKKGRQAGYTFYHRNIQDLVSRHIKSLAEQGKLILGSPYNGIVSLIFQLDKGGVTTKCGIAVSNLQDKVGSPNNFILLGLSSLSESYDAMSEAFGDVFRQVNDLYGTTLVVKIKSSEVTLQLRVKVGGDFKSVCMLMGHGGASCKLMCPICVSPKPVMKDWDVWREWPYRENYTPGERNISRKPLMPSIKSTDICVPITHVLTGLVKKLMAMLEKKLLGEAEEWNDDDEDELAEIVRLLKDSTDGLDAMRQFKSRVNEISRLAATIPNNSDGCSKFCLHALLSADTSLDWDLVFCSCCSKFNHVTCLRNWQVDDLTTTDSSQFKCLECAGVTGDDLLRRDGECLRAIGEQESEMLDQITEYQSKIDELTQQKARSDSALMEELKKMRIDCGVYPRFYYHDLVGCDARRLTLPENAAKLWGLIEDEQVRQFGTSLFDALHQLFSILSTGFQSDEERAAFGYLIERICTLWTTMQPSETITLKLHSLIHLREAMSREGHAGREVETIEHVHRRVSRACAVCASSQPRYRVVFTACGHSICRACGLQMKCEASKDGDELACPFCRTASGFAGLCEVLIGCGEHLPDIDQQMKREDAEDFSAVNAEIIEALEASLASFRVLTTLLDAAMNAYSSHTTLEKAYFESNRIHGEDHPNAMAAKDAAAEALLAAKGAKESAYAAKIVAENHDAILKTKEQARTAERTARDERIACLRRENDESAAAGLRFSRVCRPCNTDSPPLRSFFPSCGHAVCRQCAENKLDGAAESGEANKCPERHTEFVGALPKERGLYESHEAFEMTPPSGTARPRVNAFRCPLVAQSSRIAVSRRSSAPTDIVMNDVAVRKREDVEDFLAADNVASKAVIAALNAVTASMKKRTALVNAETDAITRHTNARKAYLDARRTHGEHHPITAAAKAAIVAAENAAMTANQAAEAASAADRHLDADLEAAEQAEQAMMSARTARIAHLRRENDECASTGHLFSRACRACDNDSPILRSFFPACGHVVCRGCAGKEIKRAVEADGAGKCPQCQTEGAPVPLFEDVIED